MNRFRFAMIAAFLGATISMPAANWDRWRGADNSGMASSVAPLRWSDTENIKWTADIAGRSSSTPIVWGDRVFLTTAIPVEPRAEATSEAGVAERLERRQARPAGGGESGPGTPEMRERIRELTGGKDLSELTREERREVMRQLRRSAREPRGRRAAGGDPRTVEIAEHRFVVIALDRNTGKTIWERTAVVARPHEGHHRRYGSFASSSPVTDGNLVYACFGSRGIYAYDMDGNLAWKKNYGVDFRMANSFGEGRSPTLHGDTLVLVFDHQGDSFVSALDKRTGEELWRRDRDERSAWSQPLVVEHAGRTEAIVAASGKIQSFDLETGDVIWECAGLGSNVIPAVVRDGDVVYAMSGHRDPNLLAIRLGGEGDITESDYVLWTNQRGNSYTASPVIDGGILYFVTDRGMLSALDAKTGQPHYQQQRLPGMSSLKASPIGAGGRLYIATEQGDVVVVGLGRDFEVLATNTIEGEFFMASPVVVDGEMLLRGQNRLYAISDKD